MFVFLNPANHQVTVDDNVPQNSGISSLRLYNNMGQHVGSYQLDNAEGRKTIATSGLPAGIYFVQIDQEGFRVGEGKFIVIPQQQEPFSICCSEGQMQRP